MRTLSLAPIICSLVLLVGLQASALPLAPGDIVVTDNETGNIVKIDPVTGLQTLLPCSYPFRRPQGVVATPTEVLFANVPSLLSLNGEIVSLTDALCAPVSSGGDLKDSDGIALELSGTVIVSSLSCSSCGAGKPPAIVRVDPVTGAQIPLSSGALFMDPEHIAVQPNGLLYVTDDGCPTCNPVTPPALFEVDPQTGAQVVVSEAGFLNDLSGVAIESDGSVLLADRGCSLCLPLIPSRVIRVDPAGPVLSNQVVVGTAGLNNQFDGVVVDAAGRILVGVENSSIDSGGVSIIDPGTGMETPLSLGLFLQDVDGITLVVPEAGATAMGACSLLALLSLARRERRPARPLP